MRVVVVQIGHVTSFLVVVPERRRLPNNLAHFLIDAVHEGERHDTVPVDEAADQVLQELVVA